MPFFPFYPDQWVNTFEGNNKATVTKKTTESKNKNNNNQPQQKVYGSFQWTAFICLKAAELLRGVSLLFNTELLGVHRTHFTDIWRMKECTNQEAMKSFWTVHEHYSATFNVHFEQIFADWEISFHYNHVDFPRFWPLRQMFFKVCTFHVDISLQLSGSIQLRYIMQKNLFLKLQQLVD